MAARANKFRPGRRIRSMNDLARQIDAGRWFYAFGPRPIHPGFIVSMPFRVLHRRLQQIRLAEPNQEQQP